MSETWFIADVHLQTTQITGFLAFLTQQVSCVERLYILGDLFEVWIGDDEDDPNYQRVLETLQQLIQQGVQVAVMPGNRDFLLGTGFATATGCQLLVDPTVIELYQEPILLMHGDTLCTQDLSYQEFRKKVRDPHWQQQFLAQPLRQRRVLAQQARQQSQTYTQELTEEISDVSPAAVVSAFTTYPVRHLIHGHTHRPAVHQLSIENTPVWRWVLGAWHAQRGFVLRCTPNRWRLVHVEHLPSY